MTACGIRAELVGLTATRQNTSKRMSNRFRISSLNQSSDLPLALWMALEDTVGGGDLGESLMLFVEGSRS